MTELISYGFLTPPAVLILIALVGVLLALTGPRQPLGVAALTLVCLYAAATPALSSYLLSRVEAGLPQNPDLSAAQAIVVLGGDMHLAPAGPDTLGPLTLERVVFAARAYRQLNLPVAVSGGRAAGAHTTLASLMKTTLETDLAVPVRWAEDQSRTTFENAADTAERLGSESIRTVVLVTQAWHMKRALWSFEKVGMRALPWPAPTTALRLSRIDDYLPSTNALQDTFHAAHELIGMRYYRERY